MWRSGSSLSFKTSVKRCLSSINIPRPVFEPFSAGSKNQIKIWIFLRREGSGRKPSIPDTVKQNIVRTARRNPNRSTTRKLDNQYEVSASFVNQLLRKKRFKYKNPKLARSWPKKRKKTELTLKNCGVFMTVNNLRPYFENLYGRYNDCIEGEGYDFNSSAISMSCRKICSVFYLSL